MEYTDGIDEIDTENLSNDTIRDAVAQYFNLKEALANGETINSQILLNTDKMTKHIDFINGAYEKITKSYFFKSILG
jgi:hypothetical protein